MRRCVVALSAALALGGCNLVVGDGAVSEAYKPVGEPLVLSVTFSEAASAKLKESGERVTLNVAYYAEPKPAVANTLEPGDVGVDLGEDNIEIEGFTQTATIPATYDIAKANKDAQGDVRVLVNVFTARKVFPDNLLSCRIYDDTLDKAGREGMSIACSLIEEPPAGRS